MTWHDLRTICWLMTAIAITSCSIVLGYFCGISTSFMLSFALAMAVGAFLGAICTMRLHPPMVEDDSDESVNQPIVIQDNQPQPINLSINQTVQGLTGLSEHELQSLRERVTSLNNKPSLEEFERAIIDLTKDPIFDGMCKFCGSTSEGLGQSPYAINLHNSHCCLPWTRILVCPIPTTYP